MSSETIRENGNLTVRETQNSNATVREGQQTANFGTVGAGSSFRDYSIVRQLPSTSTEADIFVVQKDNADFILKLYRYGIEPKNDILQSIKSLSERYPDNFIRVFEADFDGTSKRWFEIQEYAKFGTLQAIIDDKSKLDGSQQNTFFNDVTSQIGEALNLLHQNNLLHLDIKPSNILLRSIKPLDMVLIDFGIATSLASDMSKKFTQTRGTPMYQSPESYTGGMGRASDWWGLGMILLEIANGTHPFKGLSPNVIAYSVATEPVNIPENLDKGQIELFHGLLTRNPEKRWNWEQVSRWLKGERDIPQFFEEASASQTVNIKPFAFMGQKCNSLAEIAAAFVKDEEAWEKGKALLMRGNIRTWLEQNGEFEQGEDLERNLSQFQDADEKMFQFTQQYGRDIPLILGGKAITLQNLLLFTGKALRKENLTGSEQKIVDMLTSGKLREIVNSYNKEHKDDNSKVLQLTLGNFSKSLKLSDIVGFLNFYLNPKKYFCPFVKDASSTEKVIKSSQGLKQPPKPLEYFTDISGKYIIPKSLLDGTENAGTYHSSLDEIEKMKNENHLILRQSSSEVEKNEKERLASASMDEYMAGMYKWQWGYDEESVKSINSSLEKFRRQVDSASGLEKAQLELWITYLEFLSKKENALADEDKHILKNTSLKETETLAERISKIITYPTTSENETSVPRESTEIKESPTDNISQLQRNKDKKVPLNQEAQSPKKKKVLIIDEESYFHSLSQYLLEEINLQGGKAAFVTKDERIEKPIAPNSRVMDYEVIDKSAIRSKEIQNCDVVVLVQFAKRTDDNELIDYSNLDYWLPQITGKNVAIIFIASCYDDYYDCYSVLDNNERKLVSVRTRAHLAIPSLSCSNYDVYDIDNRGCQQDSVRKDFEPTIKNWVAQLLNDGKPQQKSSQNNNYDSFLRRNVTKIQNNRAKNKP